MLSETACQTGSAGLTEVSYPKKLARYSRLLRQQIPKAPNARSGTNGRYTKLNSTTITIHKALTIVKSQCFDAML